MTADIKSYHNKQTDTDKLICEALYKLINENLPEAESKVWHAHPVWFLDGNPIVGYSKLKHDLRLMFWSGQSFNEPKLTADGSFKAATVRYTDVSQINPADIKRFLRKAIDIQWNYRDIVRNRGLLELMSRSHQHLRHR